MAGLLQTKVLWPVTCSQCGRRTAGEVVDCRPGVVRVGLYTSVPFPEMSCCLSVGVLLTDDELPLRRTFTFRTHEWRAQKGFCKGPFGSYFLT